MHDPMHDRIDQDRAQAEAQSSLLGKPASLVPTESRRLTAAERRSVAEQAKSDPKGGRNRAERRDQAKRSRMVR